MNIKFEVIKLENEDVVSTSCAFDTLNKSFGLSDYIGGSIKYVTGSSWDTKGGGGAVFYDKDAIYLGATSTDNDYRYFEDGHYYHMTVRTSGDTRSYYIECDDPDHFLN